MVCQRNKTHRKSREDFLYISPGFNIVTSKTRKVFYNDTVHLSCFDVAYHSFKFWSVEITARKPIININIIQFDILLFMDKGSDQLSLISDTVTLGFQSTILVCHISDITVIP